MRGLDGGALIKIFTGENENVRGENENVRGDKTLEVKTTTETWR